MSDETKSDVETELAALKARIEELERKAKPPAPRNFDTPAPGPTTTQLAMNRVSLSPEVMAEFAQAVGDLRGAWPSPTVGPTSMVVDAKTPKATAAPAWTENKSGWRDARPLGPPDGINHVDRLCEAQDVMDRAELIAQEARRLAKK
jgi:hypothetical protein